MEKASTILKKSLKFFGPKGEHWAQDFYKTGTGKAVRFCAVGALLEVGASSPDAVDLAHVYLETAINDERGVETWNDIYGRKFSEVKAAFLKAIKLAEQQEKG